MLNLIELEKSLDDALAKETRASLTEWLTSMRFPNMETLFGAGSLVNLDELSYSTQLTPGNETTLVGESGVSEDNCLQMAA